MITKKNRVYMALSTYFIAMVGLFYTGSMWWFLLVVAAIFYVIIGGRKHV